MGNTVTDKLNLVTASTVTRGILPWAQTIQAGEGFRLLIFSASGVYKGEVSDKALRMHLGHSDMMLRVNLGQRLFSFSGELLTADRNLRDYRATVVLRVSDPWTFAICYRQECDPVQLLQRAMQGSISRWAQQTACRDVSFELVRQCIEEGASATQAETGISLVRIEECVVELSSYSQELERIRKNERIARAQHEFQAHRHEERLAEKNKDYQAVRRKIDLDARLKETIAVRSQIFNTLMQAQQQRLHKYLEQGATWKNVQEHDPEMFELLSQLFSPSGEQHLVLPTTRPGAPSSETHRLDIDESHALWEPRLGAQLTLAELTRGQWRAIEAKELTVRHAFRVGEIDASGPAAASGLRVDDIVVQIDHQHLGSDATLAMRLSHILQGKPISIAILRGAHLLSIDVVLAPWP